MSIKVDITNRQFDLVDMDNCNLWIQVPRQLGQTLAIEFSNLVLHTSESECTLTGAIEDLPFNLHKSNIFIHGFATMKFNSPIQLDLDVSIYDESSEKLNFIFDQNGDVVRIKRSITNPLCSQEGVEYNLGGQSLWPYGDCDISLQASGSAYIEFSASNCISAEEFAKAPSKWLANYPFKG